ncbi:MAG TPA: glycosyltransferase [Anaerolineae bacterium]|nr:glycosyltransferase [Anaerolineae bacterium]
MSASPVDLSLVLACYNEELVIEGSVADILQVLDDTRYSYEFIFVDDCSKDRTRDLIDRLIERYPDKRMSRIFHRENKGRGGTVSDGIRAAHGDVAGFIDIDLEVHARYIPSCVTAVEHGADIAVGRRVYKLNLRSLDRYLMSAGYIWLVRRFLGVDLNDTETGYKFFKRERILPLLDEIEDQHWFWDTEVMVRSYYRDYQIVEIPCLFLRRFDRTSTVDPLSDTVDYFRKLWRFRKVVKDELTR